jgi:hypothetical protein
MRLEDSKEGEPLITTRGEAGRAALIKQVIEQLDAGLGSRQANQQSSSPTQQALGANALPEKHYELVMMLYTQYSAKFINDNNKIWATGTIFIPLSLAGLLYLKDMTLYNTCLLGIGSFALMLLWVLVEESHRAFQNKSQAVTEAIERHIGLDFKRFSGPKLNYPQWLDWYFCKVRSLRWLMLVAVFSFWVAAAIGKWKFSPVTSPAAEPSAKEAKG